MQWSPVVGFGSQHQVVHLGACFAEVPLIAYEKFILLQGAAPTGLYASTAIPVGR